MSKPVNSNEESRNLHGRVAWVTGGARGIGAAIAPALQEHGATVCVTDRLAAANVDPCDMNDPSAIAAYVKRLVSIHGRLDILVNNAAIQCRRPFVDFSEEDYETTFGINVRGVFLASQAAAKAMIAAGRGGNIVNVSSINAMHARPETALYCASKGAISTMTRALAVAFGGHGIRVNAIAPGTIVTDFNRDRLIGDDVVRNDESTTALGRLGSPADIAPTVAFLVSDEADFITGACVPIHGGRTLKA